LLPPKHAEPTRSAAAAVWSVSIFLAATLIVCVPSQVFVANPTEFPMAFSDVLPLIVMLGIASAVASAIGLLALPRGRVRETALVFVFAVSCLAWVQSHLPWPYGIADGRAVDWPAFRLHGILDLAVWAVGLSAAVWWRQTLVGAVATTSLVLTLVQALALSIDAARMPHRWIDDVTFDESSRFAFSPDRNVVILVLDTFQTDLFQELLDHDPSLADRLAGFTYFRNATGGFPSTAAAIPLMLTGRYYDNTEPFQDFVRETYRTASLQAVLTGAGFDVYYHNLYFWPSLYADETISSHVRAKGILRYGPQARDGANRLLTFGAFRYFPQPGKRLIESRIAALVMPKPATVSEPAAPPLMSLQPGPQPVVEPPLPGDGPFFQHLAQSATATSARPTFKYFHLWGLHPPLTHDEALAPMKAPYTRVNALRQASGLLRLVDRLLATLKQLGIHDRSTIAVLGDHGTAFGLRLAHVDASWRTHPAARPVATRHAFGLPLVLFKRPGDAGPLRVSDAAVTLGDLPATVMDTLSIPSGLPGLSMFSPDIQPRRTRRVLFYPPSQLNLSAGYFPPLREYQVSGFSWLQESWMQTGRVFRPSPAQ
jgi:hypothetical protein